MVFPWSMTQLERILEEAGMVLQLLEELRVSPGVVVPLPSFYHAYKYETYLQRLTL
jgi:hypothetical protein